MVKFTPIILPQPGEDLRTWARQLTSQLQALSYQLQSAFSETGRGAYAPIYAANNTLVLDKNGYYIDGMGRAVVTPTGLKVYDLSGFPVIDGPHVYINTEHLVDNAVNTAKLAAGAVTEVNIDDDAITAPKLQANSVVAGKLAANAIVANDGVIGVAAIASAQIAYLDANKITAGSIAAERMEANIVTALNGKFATLSALASSLGAVQILSGGALFTQGATAYATGTGVWMGQDGGVYKWRAGNPAGARIQWTGSALEVYNSSNQLTIASGNVDWAGVINKTGFAAISQITSSNVTTYIDNAAIGNAQIGGNLWSTNWNYAGGSGWLLDRSGNFYGNNIYARGDIEASSLKANTLMVQTAHVAGNAITVPIAASGTTSCQTAVVDFGGSPVAVTFTGGAYVSTTNSNVTTGTVSAYLKRNGSVIYTLRCFTATVVDTDPGYFGSAAFTFIDYPGAGSHYYSVEVFKSSGLAATTLTQQQCSVLAIGVKR